jgi:hypothetical protein
MLILLAIDSLVPLLMIFDLESPVAECFTSTKSLPVDIYTKTTDEEIPEATSEQMDSIPDCCSYPIQKNTKANTIQFQSTESVKYSIHEFSSLNSLLIYYQ